MRHVPRRCVETITGFPDGKHALVAEQRTPAAAT
jgi:hypothetical protein